MGPKRRGGGGGGGGAAEGDYGGGGGGGEGPPTLFQAAPEGSRGGRGGGGGGQRRGQRRQRRGGGGGPQDGRNEDWDGPRHHQQQLRQRQPRGGGGGGREQQQQQQRPHPPPPRERLVSECGEDHCPVCLSRASIWAVGRCNHHVCAECSTRLRVLSTQNDCPICRQELPKVVFCEGRRCAFEEVENEPYRMERRYRVCFENGRVEDAFWRLLEHRCPICCQEDDDGGKGDQRPFRTFRELDKHVRRSHDLFYCELCVEHLTIFTHERRLYSRTDLATHRRKGDPDDTSHRGHPQCEFCQTRFMDKDELYRHLRRDHFFCHFCDADGKQEFYPDYEELRGHFESDHFLCTEGDCVNEQFTSAFRTEIDLKAHKAERHVGAFQSKADARQNRVVDLEFNYSRPTARDQTSRRRGRDAAPSPPTSVNVVDSVDGLRGGAGVRNEEHAGPGRAPDMSAESFPSLGASGGGGAAGGRATAAADSLARRLNPSSGHSTSWASGHKVPKEEDFPSLPGAPSPVHSAPTTVNGGARRKQLQQQQARGPKTREEEFPSLGGPAKAIPASLRSGGTQMYREVPGRPQTWTEAAAVPNHVVGVVNGNSADGQKPKKGLTSNMVTLTKSKQPAPAPVIPSDDAEFPGLGGPLGSSEEVSKKSQESTGNKKKKKSKSAAKAEDGFTLSSMLKGDANLKSAADLILLDKGNKSAKNKIKKENKPPPSREEDNIAEDGEEKSSPEEREKDDDWMQVEIAKPSKPKETPLSKPTPSGPSIPGLGLEMAAMAIGGGAKGGSSSTPRPPPGFGQKKEVEEDFPSLGGPAKSQVPSREPTPFAPAPSLSSSSSARGGVGGQPQPPQPYKKPPEAEDFPTLGGASKKMSANFRPVVLNNGNSNNWTANSKSNNNPPPTSSTGAKSKKPPPGFGNVKPSKTPRPDAVYRQPHDFAARNKSLVSSVTRVLGGKSLEFSRFKDLSGRFRRGEVNCRDFYDECLALTMSSGDCEGEAAAEALMKFFPELIALLPDIKKQKELYEVHADRFHGHGSSSSLSLVGRVLSCPDCGQILARSDAAPHGESHAKDSDFPMLG